MINLISRIKVSFAVLSLLASCSGLHKDSRVENDHHVADKAINNSRNIASFSYEGKKIYDYTSQEIEALIEKDFGKILRHSENEELYTYLNKIFQKLSDAQKTFISDSENMHITNRLLIVEDKFPNAFCLHIQKPNSNTSENVVAITSSLINMMLEESPGKVLDSNSANLFENRMAGVLAHELSHPFDYYDMMGIVHSYLRMGDQAREIRADTEGTLLAKEAKFPATSVLEMLNHLYSYEDGKSTPLTKAATQDHPDDLIRKSVQKIFLTLNRYKNGELIDEKDFKPIVTPDVFNELVFKYYRPAINNSEYVFRTPQSIHEAYSRMCAIIKHKADMKNNEMIEYNYLLMHIGNFVKDYDSFDDFADEDAIAFKDLISKYVKGEHNVNLYMIFSKASVLNSIRDLNTKEELSDMRAWRVHIERSKFFQSDSYRKFLYEELENEWVKNERFPAYYLDVLFSVNHGREFDFAKFFDRKYKLTGSTNDLFQKIEQIVNSSADKVYKQYFLSTLVDNFLSDVSDEQLFSFFNNFTRRDYPIYDKLLLPVIFGANNKYQKDNNVDVGVRSNTMLFRGKGNEKAFEAQKKWLSFLWEKRDVLILLDFSRENVTVDWDYIWEGLGLDKAIARGELQRSVKKLTTSEMFANHIKKIYQNRDMYNLGIDKNVQLKYYDRGLEKFFSGENNKFLKDNEEYVQAAKTRFLRQYLFCSIHTEGISENAYQNILKNFDIKKYDNPQEALESLDKILQTKLGRAAGQSTKIHMNQYIQILDKFAGYNDLGVLKNLLFSGGGFYSREIDFHKYGQWMLSQKKYIEDIYQILHKHKLINSRFDFLVWTRNNLLDTAGNLSLSSAKYLLAGSSWFESDFSEIDFNNYSQIKSLSEIMFFPCDDNKECLENNEIIAEGGLASKHSQRKSFLNQLSKSNLDVEKKIEIFSLVTRLGTTNETDDWFVDNIFPELNKYSDLHKRSKILEPLLKNKQFSKNSVKVAVLDLCIEDEIIDAIKYGDVADTELLVEKMNDLVPVASKGKDDLFEKIAWNFDLNGERLKRIIEDKKSTNWRLVDPRIVNLGSGLANIMKAQLVSDDLIFDYVLNPSTASAEFLKDIIYNFSVNAANSVDIFQVREFSSKQNFAQIATERALREIEAAIKDSSIAGKAAILEILLSKNKNSSVEYLLSKAVKHGGYESGSTEYKLLHAFLNVIPVHERSVTMAYLLASRNEGGGVKSLFEVFQTVGIKFGQLAAIWNVFGEKITQEIAELKDDAEPLSKFEIEKILRETYGKRSEQIHLKRVLGSASVKTVVEVTLADGRDAVLMVRRPHIEAQIKSNLKLSIQLLDESRKLGVEIPKGMFSLIIEDLGGQLNNEIDFKKEANKIKKTKQIFDNINLSLGKDDYKFFVPQVIKDFPVESHLMLVEKGTGDTWKSLTKGLAKNSDKYIAIQKRSGKNIFKTLIKTFTQFGFFNPDSHGGNILVDDKKKIISIIDLGQAEEYVKTGTFSQDDRLIVAQFLEAYSNENAEKLVTAMEKMSDSKNHRKTKLISTIKSIIDDKAIEQNKKLIEIITASTDNGLKLKSKFSFGLIKGLMVLTGEEYADQSAMKVIIKQEFEAVVKEKLPAYIFTSCRDAISLILQ